MVIYLINFALIIFWGNFLRDKRISTTIILVQIFLILALKDVSVGADWEIYSSGYEYISRLSFDDILGRLHLVDIAELEYPYAFESGYTLLNWVIAHLGFSYKGFFIIISFFMIFSIGKFVKKYSEQPWLSLLLYVSLGFYAYDFGILRQAIALHILLFAFPAIVDRKFLKFLFIVFFASLIHRTAIICIPLYFFGNKKFTRNTIAISFVIDIVLVLFTPSILEFFVFPIFSLLGKESYVDMLSFSLNSLIMTMLIIMSILFASVNLRQCRDYLWKTILWAFAFSTFIEIIGCYSEIFGRIIQYYYIYIVLLIPKVIYNYKERNTKVIVSFALIFLLLAFYIYSLNVDSAIVPYKIFLNL